MVSPLATVVASSSELRPAHVGLAPDISFSEERSAWGTTPGPEAPSNVHAIESATPPTSEDPPLSWNWICPIEIGNHVTDRSLEQGALHAEAARVRDGRTAGRARVSTSEDPPLSWNWICPIEIGNHVTDRSLEQGALHAEAARV